MVNAEEGDDLARLGERSDNQWAPLQTAIANGLEEENAPLAPDWPVKIAREEPFSVPENEAP